MNRENFFIGLFPSGRIGDDGAKVGKWVYSKDLFAENIHFKTAWLNPYQIGYKAMIVNVSDAIAMNARPAYALLGIAMPKTMCPEAMRSLSEGLKDAASEFGIEIIGGDTIANTKLDLSVTIISQASEWTLTRYGLREGDLIAHTGTIGKSGKELRYLLSGGKVHSRSRFVSPKPRRHFVARAVRFLRAGMDISDGLYSDMGKLSALNKKGFHFRTAIPKSKACSGEEYEMLVAFSPREQKAVKRIAKMTRTPLKVVAEVRRGKFINRCKAHHF